MGDDFEICLEAVPHIELLFWRGHTYAVCKTKLPITEVLEEFQGLRDINV